MTATAVYTYSAVCMDAECDLPDVTYVEDQARQCALIDAEHHCRVSGHPTTVIQHAHTTVGCFVAEPLDPIGSAT